MLGFSDAYSLLYTVLFNTFCECSVHYKIITFCFGQFDKAYDISMIDELLNILWGID